MDDLDLYDDLDAFQEQQERKSKELQDAEEKYQKSLTTIQSLEQENKALTKKVQRIELSFQSLLDTARTEIRRKDKEIERLRKEKDDVCFRRKFPNRSKETETSLQQVVRNPFAQGTVNETNLPDHKKSSGMEDVAIIENNLNERQPKEHLPDRCSESNKRLRSRDARNLDHSKRQRCEEDNETYRELTKERLKDEQVQRDKKNDRREKTDDLNECRNRDVHDRYNERKYSDRKTAKSAESPERCDYRRDRDRFERDHRKDHRARNDKVKNASAAKSPKRNKSADRKDRRSSRNCPDRRERNDRDRTSHHQSMLRIEHSHSTFENSNSVGKQLKSVPSNETQSTSDINKNPVVIKEMPPSTDNAENNTVARDNTYPYTLICKDDNKIKNSKEKALKDDEAKEIEGDKIQMTIANNNLETEEVLYEDPDDLQKETLLANIGSHINDSKEKETNKSKEENSCHRTSSTKSHHVAEGTNKPKEKDNHCTSDTMSHHDIGEVLHENISANLEKQPETNNNTSQLQAAKEKANQQTTNSISHLITEDLYDDLDDNLVEEPVNENTANDQSQEPAINQSQKTSKLGTPRKVALFDALFGPSPSSGSSYDSNTPKNLLNNIMGILSKTKTDDVELTVTTPGEHSHFLVVASTLKGTKDVAQQHYDKNEFDKCFAKITTDNSKPPTINLTDELLVHDVKCFKQGHATNVKSKDVTSTGVPVKENDSLNCNDPKDNLGDADDNHCIKPNVVVTQINTDLETTPENPSIKSRSHGFSDVRIPGLDLITTETKETSSFDVPNDVLTEESPHLTSEFVLSKLQGKRPHTSHASSSNLDLENEEGNIDSSVSKQEDEVLTAVRVLLLENTPSLDTNQGAITTTEPLSDSSKNIEDSLYGIDLSNSEINMPGFGLLSTEHAGIQSKVSNKSEVSLTSMTNHLDCASTVTIPGLDLISKEDQEHLEQNPISTLTTVELSIAKTLTEDCASNDNSSPSNLPGSHVASPSTTAAIPCHDLTSPEASGQIPPAILTAVDMSETSTEDCVSSGNSSASQISENQLKNVPAVPNPDSQETSSAEDPNVVVTEEQLLCRNKQQEPQNQEDQVSTEARALVSESDPNLDVLTTTEPALNCSKNSDDSLYGVASSDSNNSEHSKSSKEELLSVPSQNQVDREPPEAIPGLDFITSEGTNKCVEESPVSNLTAERISIATTTAKECFFGDNSSTLQTLKHSLASPTPAAPILWLDLTSPETCVASPKSIISNENPRNITKEDQTDRVSVVGFPGLQNVAYDLNRASVVDEECKESSSSSEIKSSCFVQETTIPILDLITSEAETCLGQNPVVNLTTEAVPPSTATSPQLNSGGHFNHVLNSPKVTIYIPCLDLTSPEASSYLNNYVASPKSIASEEHTSRRIIITGDHAETIRNSGLNVITPEIQNIYRAIDVVEEFHFNEMEKAHDSSSISGIKINHVSQETVTATDVDLTTGEAQQSLGQNPDENLTTAAVSISYNSADDIHSTNNSSPSKAFGNLELSSPKSTVHCLDLTSPEAFSSVKKHFTPTSGSSSRKSTQSIENSATSNLQDEGGEGIVNIFRLDIEEMQNISTIQKCASDEVEELNSNNKMGKSRDSSSSCGLKSDDISQTKSLEQNVNAIEDDDEFDTHKTDIEYNEETGTETQEGNMTEITKNSKLYNCSIDEKDHSEGTRKININSKSLQLQIEMSTEKLNTHQVQRDKIINEEFVELEDNTIKTKSIVTTSNYDLSFNLGEENDSGMKNNDESLEKRSESEVVNIGGGEETGTESKVENLTVVTASSEIYGTDETGHSKSGKSNEKDNINSKSLELENVTEKFTEVPNTHEVHRDETTNEEPKKSNEDKSIKTKNIVRIADCDLSEKLTEENVRQQLQEDETTVRASNKSSEELQSNHETKNESTETIQQIDTKGKTVSPEGEKENNHVESHATAGSYTSPNNDKDAIICSPENEVDKSSSPRKSKGSCENSEINVENSENPEELNDPEKVQESIESKVSKEMTEKENLVYTVACKKSDGQKLSLNQNNLCYLEPSVMQEFKTNEQPLQVDINVTMQAEECKDSQADTNEAKSDSSSFVINPAENLTSKVCEDSEKSYNSISQIGNATDNKDLKSNSNMCRQANIESSVENVDLTNGGKDKLQKLQHDQELQTSDNYLSSPNQPPANNLNSLQVEGSSCVQFNKMVGKISEVVEKDVVFSENSGSTKNKSKENINSEKSSENIPNTLVMLGKDEEKPSNNTTNETLKSRTDQTLLNENIQETTQKLETHLTGSEIKVNTVRSNQDLQILHHEVLKSPCDSKTLTQKDKTPTTVPVLDAANVNERDDTANVGPNKAENNNENPDLKIILLNLAVAKESLQKRIPNSTNVNTANSLKTSTLPDNAPKGSTQKRIIINTTVDSSNTLKSSTLSDCFNAPTMLPSISTDCPTPSNFSGIFSKKSQDSGEDSIKNKKKSPKIKEYILPAASVLCNMVNLKNATKTKPMVNKKLHWELLENKNEITEMEDDTDPESTDANKLSKVPDKFAQKDPVARKMEGNVLSIDRTITDKLSLTPSKDLRCLESIKKTGSESEETKSLTLPGWNMDAMVKKSMVARRNTIDTVPITHAVSYYKQLEELENFKDLAITVNKCLPKLSEQLVITANTSGSEPSVALPAEVIKTRRSKKSRMSRKLRAKLMASSPIRVRSAESLMDASLFKAAMIKRKKVCVCLASKARGRLLNLASSCKKLKRINVKVQQIGSKDKKKLTCRESKLQSMGNGDVVVVDKVEKQLESNIVEDDLLSSKMQEKLVLKNKDKESTLNDMPSSTSVCLPNDKSDEEVTKSIGVDRIHNILVASECSPKDLVEKDVNPELDDGQQLRDNTTFKTPTKKGSIPKLNTKLTSVGYEDIYSNRSFEFEESPAKEDDNLNTSIIYDKEHSSDGQNSLAENSEPECNKYLKDDELSLKTIVYPNNVNGAGNPSKVEQENVQSSKAKNVEGVKTVPEETPKISEKSFVMNYKIPKLKKSSDCEHNSGNKNKIISLEDIGIKMRPFKGHLSSFRIPKMNKASEDPKEKSWVLESYKSIQDITQDNDTRQKQEARREPRTREMAEKKKEEQPRGRQAKRDERPRERSHTTYEIRVSSSIPRQNEVHQTTSSKSKEASIQNLSPDNGKNEHLKARRKSVNIPRATEYSDQLSTATNLAKKSVTSTSGQDPHLTDLKSSNLKARRQSLCVEQILRDFSSDGEGSSEDYNFEDKSRPSSKTSAINTNSASSQDIHQSDLKASSLKACRKSLSIQKRIRDFSSEDEGSEGFNFEDKSTVEIHHTADVKITSLKDSRKSLHIERRIMDEKELEVIKDSKSTLKDIPTINSTRTNTAKERTTQLTAVEKRHLHQSGSRDRKYRASKGTRRIDSDSEDESVHSNILKVLDSTSDDKSQKKCYNTEEQTSNHRITESNPSLKSSKSSDTDQLRQQRKTHKSKDINENSIKSNKMPSKSERSLEKQNSGDISHQGMKRENNCGKVTNDQCKDELVKAEKPVKMRRKSMYVERKSVDSSNGSVDTKQQNSGVTKLPEAVTKLDENSTKSIGKRRKSMHVDRKTSNSLQEYSAVISQQHPCDNKDNVATNHQTEPVKHLIIRRKSVHVDTESLKLSENEMIVEAHVNQWALVNDNKVNKETEIQDTSNTTGSLKMRRRSMYVDKESQPTKKENKAKDSTKETIHRKDLDKRNDTKEAQVSSSSGIQINEAKHIKSLRMVKKCEKQAVDYPQGGYEFSHDRNKNEKCQKYSHKSKTACDDKDLSNVGKFPSSSIEEKNKQPDLIDAGRCSKSTKPLRLRSKSMYIENANLNVNQNEIGIENRNDFSCKATADEIKEPNCSGPGREQMPSKDTSYPSDSDTSTIIRNINISKMRRKSINIQRRILDSSSDEADNSLPPKPVIQQEHIVPPPPPARKKHAPRKRRIVKVLSTSHEDPHIAKKSKHTIDDLQPVMSPISPTLNHPIFHTQVRDEPQPDINNMTPLSQDDRFEEIDSTMQNMFHSPLREPDFKSQLTAQDSTMPLIPEPLNDSKPNLTIDETACSNRENEQSPANISELQDSKSLNSLSSHNHSDTKHLSLGSSEYRFEKVSENVVNLFISRKRRRKRTN